MDAALRSLLDEVPSPDAETASGAILRIGMLLERTRGLREATAPANQQLYQAVLPVPLQRLEMTGADHDLVVRTLASVTIPGDRRPGVIWAMGKAHVIPGLRGLVRVLDRAADLSDAEWYQACISLHDLLELAEPADVPAIRELLGLHDAAAKLRALLPNGEAPLSEAVSAALTQIGRWLGPERPS